MGTIGLALCLIPFGILSDRVGRRGVMLVGLLVASLLTLACAMAGPFWQLLVLRGLVGCALAGVPAIALAYVSEEWHQSTARGVAYLVAGNALGGLSGRIAASLFGELFSWRMALGVLGLVGLMMCGYLYYRLPLSRHFHVAQHEEAHLGRDLLAHLRTPILWRLYLLAFLLMGIFISAYNYIGYRLLAPPLSLSPLLAGWIFLLFLLGPPTIALATKQSDRLGPSRVMMVGVGLLGLGLALMLIADLWVLLGGLAAFTVGYFVVYNVAGAWVARSVRRARALGSSLYLCAFYMGASWIGSGSGLMWQAGGWPAIVCLLLLLVIGLGWVAYGLDRLSVGQCL